MITEVSALKKIRQSVEVSDATIDDKETIFEK